MDIDNGASSADDRAVVNGAAGVSAVSASAPSADQLLEFGYWIGDYMGTCRSCGEQIFNVGKRASRCEECATKAFYENEHYVTLERQNSFDRFVDAVSQVDGEDVLVGGYLFRRFELVHVAQAIEAHRAKTAGLGPKDESAVLNEDAPA